MIKANELRIGNLTYLNGRLNKINQTDFKNWTFDSLNPIPLSPEILDMLDVEKDELHNCYVIWQSDSNVDIEFFDGMVHLVGHNSAEPLDNCKYLHQLQNLYFDLTGKELQGDLTEMQKVNLIEK